MGDGAHPLGAVGVGAGPGAGAVHGAGAGQGGRPGAGQSSHAGGGHWEGREGRLTLHGCDSVSLERNGNLTDVAGKMWEVHAKVEDEFPSSKMHVVKNRDRWLFVEALAPSASCTGGTMSCILNVFAL